MTELLGKLEKEVQELEHKALEQMPQEIQRKQRHMEELQQVRLKLRLRLRPSSATWRSCSR